MEAFGAPGIPPTWSRGGKDLVSTALGDSRVWLSLGQGILNEVYWPDTGHPQIRDLGFIVAGEGFWQEVKVLGQYSLSTPAPEVPLAKILHQHERFRLELEFLPHPQQSAVLIRYRLEGDGLGLYVLLAPHLGGSGQANSAWASSQALTAAKNDHALALLNDAGFARASAGFVGSSDGWQDFNGNAAMTWNFDSAQNGNVALLGQLTKPAGLLALAFAPTVEQAQTLAASVLQEDYASLSQRFIQGWQDWSAGLVLPTSDPALRPQALISAMVLKVHEDKDFPGARVASLAVPWGFSKDDLGGYHLVWPRDLVEAGFALLALGLQSEATVVLRYLASRQMPDGHWPQNFYPDGSPYWTGIQLDETALPIVLAAKLKQAKGDLEPTLLPVLQKALAFVAQTGPYSPQDRWEENSGINPFTLTVCIAALVLGVEQGFLSGPDAEYALSLADNWNARLEEWNYVHGTALDHHFKLSGHYVRISPPGQTASRGRVLVQNRDGENLRVRELVSLEFLACVRYGLRSPHDPRIVDSVRLVDQMLSQQTPKGTFYHRYNDDGYGEDAQGNPFMGQGMGRLWPLLTAERGEYAVQAGQDPLPFLKAIVKATSSGGMIPEQIWDGPAIPEKFLFPGEPSGSAMPLVWSHAEYLKLLWAQTQGQTLEYSPALAQRYAQARRPAQWHWRMDSPLGHIAAGETLLIEDTQPFRLHFGHDGWQNIQDLDAQPLGLGLYGVRLEPKGLKSLEFTRYFPQTNGWDAHNSQVRVE